MSHTWMAEEINRKFGSWYPVKLDFASLKDNLDPNTISEIHRYTLEADQIRRQIHRLLHTKKAPL